MRRQLPRRGLRASVRTISTAPAVAPKSAARSSDAEQLTAWLARAANAPLAIVESTQWLGSYGTDRSFRGVTRLAAGAAALVRPVAPRLARAGRLAAMSARRVHYQASAAVRDASRRAALVVQSAVASTLAAIAPWYGRGHEQVSVAAAQLCEIAHPLHPWATRLANATGLPAGTAALLEPLEGRQLFSSIALVNGTLTVTGNPTVGTTLAINDMGNGIAFVQAGALHQKYPVSAITSAVITGGAGNDNFWSSPNFTFPETITAGAGNDLVKADNGSNYVDAGAGNDTVYTHAGNDTIIGSTGTDYFDSGAGNDSVVGGTGNSTLLGEAGNDTLTGGAGNDSINGGAGNDSINGGAGNDWLYGGAGNDIINGGAGNDIINGGQTGVDTLVGGGGTDQIISDGLTGSTSSSGSSPSSPSSGTTGTTGGGTPTSGAAWSTVTSAGTNGSPTAVLKMLGSTIYASQSVQVDGRSSTVTAGSPLTTQYNWNFGDAGSSYNTLQGFNAAHNYATAGTYTVTLTIIDENGKSTTASSKVTVLPDTRTVIYVASNGSDSNDGLSPNDPVQTFARANALRAANTSILFRRGDTFDVTQTLQFNTANQSIGAYGSGANPILKMSSNANGKGIISCWTSAVDATVSNITFDSIWPVVGTIANKIGVESVIAAGTNVSVLNCQFLNVDYGVDTSLQPTGCLVQGCTAPLSTGVRAYFIWGDGTDATYIGNSCANSTREHDIRTSGLDGQLIAYNTMTNLDRSSVDPQDYSKGSIEVQQGSWDWVAHNTVADGDLRVGPLSTTLFNGVMTYTEWNVVEDNSVTDTPLQIDAGALHTIVRNNVVTEPNTKPGISVNGTDGYGRVVNDLTIVNNTVYNPNAYGIFLNLIGAAQNVVLANNLFVAPDLTTGANGSGSLYIEDSDLSSFITVENNAWQLPAAGTLWSGAGANYIGAWGPSTGYKTIAQWAAYTQVDGDIFTDTAMSGWTPSSSSAAATEAMPFLGVFDDYYGNARPANASTWTAGAVQV